MPADHQPGWNQTDAALFRGRLLDDVQALRKGVAAMEDWYGSLIRRGQELWTFAGHKPGIPRSWPDWHQQVQTLLADADAEIDPVRQIERYRLTARVDYASELAHQKLSDAAHRLAREARMAQRKA